MNEVVHKPVLLQELIRFISVKAGESFVDFTVGTGGHLLAICRLIGEKGRALGIDRDEKALEIARKRVKAEGNCQVQIVNALFSEAESILQKCGFIPFNVGLFDLGISSLQLEDASRGFSYLRDGELNMQMGKSSKSAFEVVNQLPEVELKRIIQSYGEEPLAGRIAHSIEEKRGESQIRTTFQLVEAIDRAIPLKRKRNRNKILARTFQSLRIFVNDELSELNAGLSAAVRHLSIGGRLGVISYHSLEDRIVKRTFRFYSERGDSPEEWVLLPLTKKPVKPSEDEIRENRRARSAKLRVVIKTERRRKNDGD